MSGLIVGTGAMVSNHCSRPSARTTWMRVCSDEPRPLSRFRSVRTLIPARAASVAWSRFRSTLSFFNRSPSSPSISSGVRCLCVVLVPIFAAAYPIRPCPPQQSATLCPLSRDKFNNRQNTADCCNHQPECDASTKKWTLASKLTISHQLLVIDTEYGFSDN
jgi:hypothetical protein